jgi:hopanoid C-2 methylase
VFNFWRTYRRTLSAQQMISCIGNGALLCLPALAHNHAGLLRRDNATTQRTYVTTTEPEGPLYSPFMRVDSAYENHFRPTMIIDAAGQLSAEVADDMMAGRARGPVRTPAPASP